ncbi:response regulator [Humidesulfovibrio sp.]
MEKQRIHVLIIDDEPMLRRSIADFLSDEDRYEILQADDGESALDLLLVSKVDICLVDLRLPGMNGIEFILKAQQANPALRFLIHTGSPEEQLPRATLQGVKGFRGALFKPITNLMELVRAIDSAVL